MSASVNVRRRRLVCAALASVATGAVAGDLGALYALQPQLASFVRPALLDLHAHRYLEAEQRLAQANALIEQDPGERWPYRFYVLPPYALAVLLQGRAAEAVALLQQAMQARDRIVSERLPRFAGLVPALDKKLGLGFTRVEYGRELVKLIQTSQVIGTGEDLMNDPGMALTDAWLLMAAALQAAGQREALVRFYGERVAPVAFDEGDPPAMVAYEYRLHAFGLALARTGAPAHAGDAWRRARAANARRLDQTMRLGAPHSVFAACTVRRQLLSASIFAAYESGQLERQQTELLLDIIETKSAGTRYAEALQVAVGTQAPDVAARLQELEDRIAALPTTVTDVRPFLALLAQHDLLSGSAARATRAGRTGFAVPEASALVALQSRLGGAAAIGFMLVTRWPGSDGAAAERRYLRYCISGREVQLRLLGAQGAIDRLIHGCRTDFLRGAATSAAATALAGQLLADLPASVTSAGEWIIDPDGALHLLPFDALPGDGGQPLLHKHSIRLVTSLRQLRDGGPGDTSSNPAVIFCDPEYGHGAAVAGASATLRWAAEKVPLGHVAPLPETRDEAQAAARALGQLGISSRVLTGSQATAQALHEIRQPMVLHVAAHAVLRTALDRGNPAGSDGENAMDLLLPGRQAGLVLSRAGGPDVVLAKDLARLSLQGTALVVLSACDTANGDIMVGEGASSLRRATELAGAQSTVAAVWQVPSAATNALMAAFYSRLAKGERPSVALRAAKLQASAAGAAPRAWAGFQLSGLDRALAHRA